MKLLKDMKIFDTVKLKENGVPVEYTVVFKATPNTPFNGHTSGTAICRNEPVSDLHRIPLILLDDDKVQVDYDGVLSAITDEEVDTNEIYSRS